MKTQDKVISLTLAKKIWETAWKNGIDLPEAENQSEIEVEGERVSINRYDVAELLEMLPVMVDNVYVYRFEFFKKFDGGFKAGYIWPMVFEFRYRVLVRAEGKSPAQALGKLFLYLLEKGLWRGKEEK